jgi:integrase/recombinase XerD
MTELRKRFIDDLTLAGYSANTRRTYVNCLALLAKHYMISPDKLSIEELRIFILYRITQSKLSSSYIRSTIRSIELFFTLTLKREWKDLGIIRPKNKKKLPVVLSKQEVNAIFDATKNLKHQTIFILAYSAGLRIREVVKLKVNDIESDRMMIKINNGKFDLQRYSILGKRTLEQLRKYYLKYRPQDWLFYSAQDITQHLSVRTVQKEFQKAVINAGIKKSPVVIHTLRHSFATHLLEDGLNLRVIQKLLGHKHVSSTAIYTHVSNEIIQKVRCPIDDFKKTNNK